MPSNNLESYISELQEIQANRRPANLPDQVVYPAGEITIPAHVTHWASERPETIAIAFEGRDYTYTELDSLHRRFAGWLSDQGVTRGDRVAVFLGNSPEFVIAFLAILRLGAVHVPVNPMFASAELAHELRDSEPKLVLTQEALVPAVEQVQQELDSPVQVLAEAGAWEDALNHEPYNADDGDLDSLAALNYTGGTTGLPKGCQHSQRHMLYTAASGAAASGLDSTPGFTSLCYMPIFWIAGEDLGILFPIVLGGTSVLLRRWDADAVLQSIEAYGVRIMIGTVENYLELMGRPDIAERDLSSLVDPQAVSFVRKMTPQVRADWATATPSSGTLREAAYGMTETHTIDSVPYGFAEDDEDLRAEPVFCGLPVPGTDIAVVEFGTQKPLPLGEVGEIVVRSPSVTDGYWRNPEATHEQLVDGWVHTGDNGRIDTEGFLHYLGRRKEMIKVKGMSVFPAEIEMLMAQHSHVESVAVVPADDPETGQRPVAFVLLHGSDTVTATELEQWAKENMATYKVPVVHVVESLPMTETGKVRKGELLEKVSR